MEILYYQTRKNAAVNICIVDVVSGLLQHVPSL